MWHILDLIKQTMSGKSIGRILFNWQVKKHCQNLSGKCLDLAAGDNPSYVKYWSLTDEADLKTADYDQSKNPDYIIPFDQPMPLADNSFDNIFLFNAIYIVKKPEQLFAEIRRVLKPGGKLFFNSPFIFNEAREPNDYRRLTSQGIELLLHDSGFSDFKMHAYGNRVTAEVFIYHSFYVFSLVRLFVFPIALLFDKLIPNKINKLHPCPLGYFVVVKK